ncbi:hypothetical protein ABZ468_10240 [Streptomyces sp. NPDC005708]|uniref:hypothetical protein n=1 Tax=Streptomyces sp. NPDC005708 TaxID=3154564 RepID=UPI0033EA71C6
MGPGRPVTARVSRRSAGRTRLRFDGWITGIGTSSGTRAVVGYWPRAPFGPFADVMLERPDGHRVLLAPTPLIATFVAGTYAFDEVRIVPVRVDVAEQDWTVEASTLTLRFTTGRRGLLGFLLRAVPAPLAARPGWISCVAVLARALPGVRICGSAGAGRYEWYGAKDLHPVVAAHARYEGEDLGLLATVEPPVRFGFGSTPRRPCLVRVTTTVALKRQNDTLRGAAPAER